MMKSYKLSNLLLSLLLVISCGKKNNHTESLSYKVGKEVYQQGQDKYASWAYVGYVPRVTDPKRVKLYVSKKGFTMRVEAQLTKEEIENYAFYLYEKASKMELVRKGEKLIKWGKSERTSPFKVYEQQSYEDFLYMVNNEVINYINMGYDANLALLRNFFPENIKIENNKVTLNLVYPITTGKPSPGKHWLTVNPKPGTYKTWYFEERRSIYKGGPSHIFGGFPAMWFNGGIGVHGPIRYSTEQNMLDGEFSNISSEGKIVSKRWQLVRKPDSHNCIRMEHHTEIRHLLPAENNGKMAQPNLQKVDIIVTNEYDQTDLDGDGKLETIGVKYYWLHPDIKPDEEKWKKQYYPLGSPKNLYEFSYRKPQLVQIKPLSAKRSDGRGIGPSSAVTMAHLNRLPL